MNTAFSRKQCRHGIQLKDGVFPLPFESPLRAEPMVPRSRRFGCAALHRLQTGHIAIPVVYLQKT